MQNLQPFHTFSIPAQAQKLIEITSVPQLKQVWDEFQRENLPVLFFRARQQCVVCGRFCRRCAD